MSSDKSTEPVKPATTEATTAVKPVTSKTKLGWPELIVAALFGLFYAYDVWEGIGNLINLPANYEILDLAESTPWWLLFVTIAIPVVCYVVAFLLGLRLSLLQKALLFLVGLVVSAGFGLATVALNWVIFSDLIRQL